MPSLPAPPRHALIPLILSLATACAQAGPSLQYKRDVQDLLSSARFDEAATYIDQQRAQYGAPNAVLFHLDHAVALHDAGRYAESDRALDLAEQRMEELYTKSFSKAAGQYFVHDATEDYAGEPYERTLLHVYRALNHLFLDQKDEAAVEARKVSLFLSDLRHRTDDALSYRDDAFAHLLSAMILEDVGALDNARISLVWARKAYASQVQPFQTPVPERILGDLLFRDVEAERAALEEEEAIAGEVAPTASAPPGAGAPAQDQRGEGLASVAAEDGGAPTVEGGEEGGEAPMATGGEAVAERAEVAFGRLEAETATAAAVAGGTGTPAPPEEGGGQAAVDDDAAPAGGASGSASMDMASAEKSASQAGPRPADASEASSAAPAPIRALDWATVPLAAGAATPATAADQSLEQGEVVVLHYNGLIPHKAERRLQIAGSEALIYVNQYPGEVEGERLSEAGVAALSQNAVVVAFPEMREVPFRVKGSWVQCLDGSCQVETILVEDIGAIARRSMSERVDAIRARTIARAAIKFAITKAAEYTTQVAMGASEATSQYAGLASALVGLIGRTAAVATEQADTRGWLTAPAQIRMARLRLPPGTHDLRIVFVDDGGQVLSSWEMPATQVAAGRRTYLHVRTSF